MSAEEDLKLCRQWTNLHARLTETRDVLRAIYHHDMEGFAIGVRRGEQMFNRQGADHAYRVLVETTMSEGVVVLSQEGTVLHCNPAFARVLSRPLEEVIGARLAAWVGAEHQTRYGALLANAAGTWRSKLQLVRADGAAVPVHVAASPLALVKQPVICLVVSDLTEHERLLALEVEQRTARAREEMLRERQEELEGLNAKLVAANQRMTALYANLDQQTRQLKHSNAMKTRFLSHISHEFRGPLNSIFALTTLLLRRADGELNGEQDEQVGFIRKAADSLLDLVNDLLDLVKIESGKIEVHPSDFEAAELLGNLRGMLPAPLLTPAVQLVFEERADIPSLYSDEGKVSQILRNFIDNALKFTERGEVRVAASHDPENDAVIFSVRDTGIGIAPPDQERIFDEFTQLESPAGSRGKGAGLGLALSRKLAALLGGRIRLKSELGIGSKFFLVLPRRYSPANETPVGPSPGARLELARRGVESLAG